LVREAICHMNSRGIRITTAFFILRKRKERKCFSVTKIFLGASHVDGVHAHIHVYTATQKKLYIVYVMSRIYLSTTECEKKEKEITKKYKRV